MVGKEKKEKKKRKGRKVAEWKEFLLKWKLLEVA